MILWFLSCTQPEVASKEYLCDAFVEHAQWSPDSEGKLHIIVDHKSYLEHQISTPTSTTLDILLIDRKQKMRGAFNRSHYQYRLIGEKGSHIIEPLDVVFTVDGEEYNEHLTEIFIDVGLEEQKVDLHGALERPEPSYSLPMWLFITLGGLFFLYQRRKRVYTLQVVSIEDEIRSLWHEIRSTERSTEHACKLLSFLLKRYLGERFNDMLQGLGPQELCQWVRKSALRPSAREAALRIIDITTQIQFGGAVMADDILEVLGRDLEVVMVRLEQS